MKPSQSPQCRFLTKPCLVSCPKLWIHMRLWALLEFLEVDTSSSPISSQYLSQLKCICIYACMHAQNWLSHILITIMRPMLPPESVYQLSVQNQQILRSVTVMSCRCHLATFSLCLTYPMSVTNCASVTHTNYTYTTNCECYCTCARADRYNH